MSGLLDYQTTAGGAATGYPGLLNQALRARQIDRSTLRPPVLTPEQRDWLEKKMIQKGLLNEVFAKYAGPNSKAFNDAMNAVGMAPLGITVWHGSPHKFAPTEKNPLGEFDFSKIGTGEGAQSYGHGGYVAEAQDVGGGYARGLSNNTINDRAINFNDPREVAALELHLNDGNIARAADRLYRAAQQRTHSAPPSIAKKASEILDEIIPRFTALQVYQAILESQASEHAARMVAMRNATDNAKELVGSLQLASRRGSRRWFARRRGERRLSPMRWRC